MGKLNTPVTLFIFKREKAVEIMRRIAQVRPSKLYIMADGPRTTEEKEAVDSCRRKVEAEITWDCEVVKNYAETNRGVYENIGIGAKWVLEREETSIFLEDDNLPEVTFFRYCEELLEKYKDDTRILWICGTNYLEEFTPADGASYMFTKHVLPCGWASWRNKYNKYYNGQLDISNFEVAKKRIEKEYYNKKLFKQFFILWRQERYKMLNGEKPASWDYQMDYTVKSGSFYGISPCVNQIKNIGVDSDSIHGGSSFSNVMTQRLCGMQSGPIQFPLKHPEFVMPDDEYEKKIAKIFLYPLKTRIINSFVSTCKKILRIPQEKSLTKTLKSRFKK